MNTVLIIKTLHVTVNIKNKVIPTIQVFYTLIYTCLHLRAKHDEQRSMTGAQEKPIAVEPLRVLRIVSEKLCPEYVRRGRHAERQTGVTRIRLLHGVERKRPNCVDAELVDVCGFHELSCGCHFKVSWRSMIAS